MLSFLVTSFLQLLSLHSRKYIKVFNNVSVVQTSFQKCLGVYLDKKLNFSQHIKEKVKIANKRIAVVK